MSKKPAAKAKTVAKPAHHAKAAAAHGGSGGAGGRHKAAASKKHVATSKHHGTAKKRGLALGEAVACCAAEAVAASARLAGWPVGDADVLALYELTADSPDAGASILATLDAAYVFGLAGVRPVSFARADLEDPRPLERPLILGLELPGPHTVLEHDGQWWSWGEPYDPLEQFPDAVLEEAWVVTWP